MSQEFGKWLLAERKAAKLTQAELATKSGISKAYIGHLENARPHTTTGAELTPSREKVIALAKGVGGNVNEALLLAGYAPEHQYPQTTEEFTEALKAFGVTKWRVPKAKMDKLTPEYFREVLEFLEFNIKGKIQQIEDNAAFHIHDSTQPNKKTA